MYFKLAIANCKHMNDCAYVQKQFPYPDVQFVFSHASNLKKDAFSVPYKTITGENQELLSVSDCAILASGTVALECAMYETPMIIAYKGPWLLYFIYLLVRCIKNVSLPNIITNKEIVPELVQGKFNIDNICYETERNLYDKEYRMDFVNALGEAKSILSDKYSAKEVANCILEMLNLSEDK